MPQDPGLAAAVKGVGLVASLRVGDVDAQQIADLFGTYEALELTHQTGVIGGTMTHTGTGSVRTVQRYLAHPNDIKRLPDASAVVNLDLAGALLYSGKPNWRVLGSIRGPVRPASPSDSEEPEKWWAALVSNQRPLACEASALPLS